MSQKKKISAETCAEIRRQHSFTEGLEPLKDQFNIGPQKLRAHLYGDCGHEVTVSSIIPPSRKRVSADECASYRKKATNDHIVEIAEVAEQSRRTVARHAFGRCSHEIDTPPADPLERGIGSKLKQTECTDLRVEYRKSDYESMLDFSAQYDMRYETVLEHLRGRCRHDSDEPPVSGYDRAASEISEETCREMRKEWRANPDLTFSDIAEELSLSAGTAERHIKFYCSHDYETVKAEEMDLFSDYFNEM